MSVERETEEVACSTHPCAPHGFDRNQSHTEDRYVCDCEYWRPDRNCAAERLKADHEAEVAGLRAALKRAEDFAGRADSEALALLWDANGRLGLLEAKLRDDAFAISFQTLGQYRAALLKALAPGLDRAGGSHGYNDVNDGEAIRLHAEAHNGGKR